MSVNAEDPVVTMGADLKSAPVYTHPLAFRREYVRSYIESSSGAPLVLIQAPPGHGKTTVLSFFAAQEGASARWIGLEPSDASLDAMVASFVSAIYGWPIAAPGPVPDVREAAKWIVGAIQELAVTSVILDNYENVAESEGANTLIEAIAEKLPAYIRLVVGSEIAPPFLKRARLRNAIVELDASDLRFDADDVARYIREVHNYDISDEAASSIARRSGGCATVINLAGQLCHDLPRYLRIDFEALPLGPTEEHMTLLLREVLARSGQPPARAARELMRGDIGHPSGSTPTDSLLEHLADRHCLVQRHATDPISLVPHKLLKRMAERL